MKDSGFPVTASLIYRCPRCRRTLRRDVPVRERLWTPPVRGMRPQTLREYQRADGRWYAAQEPWGCDCGSYMRHLGEIEARFDPGIACTSSCRTALGPKCTCSCGGRNHGLAFLIGGI